jgi:hypothetical protein
MAVVTPEINGYPVLEINVMKARHTGRIWSQYELDETSFSTGLAYNGMILAIDDAAKSVKLPVATSTADEVYALHFSVEEEYESKGLNTFAVGREAIQKEPNVSVQLPRMFEMSVGDAWHTNCVKLDGSNIKSIDAVDNQGELESDSLKALLEAGTAVYGSVDPSGYVMLNTSKPTVGPVLQVVKLGTMPNGDWGVKIVVRKA